MTEDKVRILNVDIDNISQEDLLRNLKKGVVVTPNIDDIMKHQKDEIFHKCASQAEFSICDSRVLQILTKFSNNPIKETIPGSSFFPNFCDYHADNENCKIFLLGAKEGVGDIAREKINARIGRQIVVGNYSPSFGFETNEEECESILQKIINSGANVVVVGLGNPKQTKWIYKFKDRLPQIDIFLALGATIDFEAGNIRRSPKIFRKIGFEWLFRTFCEPKRMFKRYFINDMPFFKYFFLSKIGKYKDPFLK